MDAGLVLMGHHGSWDDAVYAESRGFRTVGFVDSPLIVADPFVAMALTAERTTTLRVGTMLAIPSNRIAPALVTAIGTVNRLAPGRTFLGLGTGFTGRAVFGLGALPISRFSEYIEACRELLTGNEIVYREGNKSRRIKLRHAKDRYIETDGVPIYVAADAPRALGVAGRLGDGWITSLQRSSVMGNSADVFASSRKSVQEAAEQSGRSIDGAYTMWSAGFCVLADGESPRLTGHSNTLAPTPRCRSTPTQTTQQSRTTCRLQFASASRSTRNGCSLVSTCHLTSSTKRCIVATYRTFSKVSAKSSPTRSCV